MRVRLDSQGRPRRPPTLAAPSTSAAPLVSPCPLVAASPPLNSEPQSLPPPTPTSTPTLPPPPPPLLPLPLSPPRRATLSPPPPPPPPPPSLPPPSLPSSTSTPALPPTPPPPAVPPPLPFADKAPAAPNAPPTRPPRLLRRPPSLLAPLPPPSPDDERASDSGSSHAEAYNSEDEHPERSGAPAAPEVPMRSLRDRELAFSRQLAARGLRIVEMRPDGNCLFRALAHAVWGDAERHAALRAKLIAYLVGERDYFSQFVAEEFGRYVRRKGRDGTHGNHLELQAAAELFGRPIEVYSYAATPATIIDSWGTPADAAAAPPEPVRVSFHRGSHYNAVQTVSGAHEKVAAAAKHVAAADTDADWLAAVDARATQDEMERAVLALSLVEATRGEAGGSSSSASSSMAVLPSTVLALIHSGYSEERAREAYRIAGHGGLAEMVRYLTTDFFQERKAVGAAEMARGANRGGTSAAHAAGAAAAAAVGKKPSVPVSLREGGTGASSVREGWGQDDDSSAD